MMSPHEARLRIKRLIPKDAWSAEFLSQTIRYAEKQKAEIKALLKNQKQ